MLWTFIITLILRNESRQSKHIPELQVAVEHTPGFYQLDATRLTNYSRLMKLKLFSAINDRNKRKLNLAKITARYGNESHIKTNAFFRLRAADEKMTKSRHKLALAQTDALLSHQISTKMNNLVNLSYEAAYDTKLDFVRQWLSKSYAK